MKRNMLLVLNLLVMLSMLLVACQPTTPVAPATEAPSGETASTEEVVATEAPAEPETPAEPAEATEAPAEPETPAEPTTTRKGGWLDEIVFSVVSGDSALSQIQAGAIDIYANGLSSRDLPAIKESGVGYSVSNGLYYDLLFNPAGPEFTDGRFNPFSNRKMREAMNWLVDRNYLNQEVYEGGALPKFFCITTQFPDYTALIDTARRLEAYYAYNMDKAKEVIDAEMAAMGAELVDGKWNYNGKPVTLTFIIRNDSDGTRVPIGDYFAAQLEAVGFTVDRQYKTGSEASPIWIGSDPKEGQWHIYTAAWSATVLDRDEGNLFQEMYLDSSVQGIPAMLQNVSDPEYKELGDKLANGQYNSLEERHEMMARALELSLQDSLQVFLIDGKNFIPFNKDVVATTDLAAGIEGASVYPFTLRFKDKEGGTLRWATQDLFAEPWNPIAGSNWTFDNGAIRATSSGYGEIIFDPYTGLYWPLRMERAEVTVKEGLPVGKTLDWVDLEFVPQIQVPEGAWVDWDAEKQVFITAGEKFPEGSTALRKTTVYYPADLFETVKWHDGSNLSLADVVMTMIMTFDRAKPESPIYDEQAVPNYDAFMATFKGYRIASTDPLVVEFYSDSYQLDAELNMPGQNGFIAYPGYTFGEGSWAALGVGNMAEAAGELAYSADKATAKEIEQTSYVGGPALEILNKYLSQAIAEKAIPYAPTLSQYLSEDEAVARYENFQKWYEEHKNFWVGTGPYYLDQAFLTEKSLVLKHYADYPDSADRWSAFGEPKIADVEIDGPGQVKIGEEAAFDVYVYFHDEPYASADIKQVKYLLHDASGAVVSVGDAELVDEGVYQIILNAEATQALSAGSNQIEVAVVPTVVSQPTFTFIEFVTTP